MWYGPILKLFLYNNPGGFILGTIYGIYFIGEVIILLVFITSMYVNH